eukprot:TRINITY_DN6296_c0_g1_i2.p1 TRINITY_DN6296_c0_g1~~TRINITY_DN6296_c0_g1_i2.p1  ORF type:complete len:334 (-),score=77.35 TRINITY_DN6296_c0_g1_i2:325-1326(-)
MMEAERGPAQMTKEEEDEWESMVRQRRNARSGGFYGGTPPHPSTLEADFTGRSSGLSEPDSAKTGEKILQHSTRFVIGYAETIGRRPTMEDEIRVVGKLRTNHQEEDYVAVFDGHGGKECSEFAAAHLHKILAKKLDELATVEQSLKQSFLELNEMIKTTNKGGGTTALVALITEKKVYIANAGDSRAVFLKGDDTTAITNDHKPDLPEEEDRIVKSGGKVTRITNKAGKTISRVNGMLAVSRALGDIFLQPHVTAEPEIHSFDMSPSDKYLILGCDGVWDVLSNEETTFLASLSDDPEEAAIKIRDTALNKGSADNISVAVIKFQKGGRSRP